VRSVIVHLRETIEEAVVAFSQRTYTRQSNITGWVHEFDGQGYALYIDIYRDGPQEFEPEDWDKMVLTLGCDPDVSVIANVSRRRPGGDQVAFFTFGLLSEFQGIAQDDYSNRYWTKQEIELGRQVEGHCFFDYCGSCDKGK
jgi:hypothetical protein